MNRLSIADRARSVSCLVEGSSIRAACRMTGISKPTVLKLVADFGTVCAAYHDAHVQTERSIGELKTGLDALAKSSEKHGAKIDSLNETVHTAKGFLKAITIIGGILGAVGQNARRPLFQTLACGFKLDHYRPVPLLSGKGLAHGIDGIAAENLLGRET